MSPTDTHQPLRVAIVAESFLPQVNGVTNSVCRVADLLAERGHKALVLAPGHGPSTYAGFPVVRTPSLPLPFYRDFAVGLPVRRTMTAVIRAFSPVHRDEGLRRELAPNGEAIVGYVGRLARDKRVDLLAHVARLRGIRLVVVGDGPERARLRRRLPDAVFTGQRTGEDLSRLYASLDVFVHTGADETFCQAVQEALASGVPVVAPASGGPLDLVVPEHNGLLYEPDSVRELRVAVGRLAHNRQVRERMAGRARPSVEHRSWDSVGEQLLDHYRAVIAPSRELAARGTRLNGAAPA